MAVPVRGSEGEDDILTDFDLGHQIEEAVVRGSSVVGMGRILRVYYPGAQVRPEERPRLAVGVRVRSRAQAHLEMIAEVEAEIAEQVLRVEGVVVPVPVGIEVGREGHVREPVLAPGDERLGFEVVVAAGGHGD